MHRHLQEDHTFHQRSKSAFLSQAGAIEKSECSDQGAWFQSQRAPGHDPLCYRSDANIFENFYSNCDVPAPKKHPVVFPQELATAYNLKCGILNLKNLIQVYDQICPSGDHCFSNKLWLHKNLLLIMCDNQLYAVPYDLFLYVVHPSQSILTSENSWNHIRWSFKETQLISKHTNASANSFGGSTKWLKLLLLRVQWRQNIYMDWSTIWSTWKIQSSWSRILTSNLLKKIHWMEIRFYPSFGQVAFVSSEMYWWIVSFSGPRTEQGHKIPNIPNLSRIRMFREDPKGWDSNWT